MSTLLIFFTAVLGCLAIAGLVYGYKQRQHSRYPWLQALAGATTRQLSEEERSAIEHYLSSLARNQQLPGPSGASAGPVTLSLSPKSRIVYSVVRSITRYGLTADDPNKWRYYLDSVEVHLPPFWEQYISDDNNVDLVITDSLPLVIGLNGHTLKNYHQETRGAVHQFSGSTASIRGEESEQIELLNIREETREEYTLSHQDNLRDALLISAAFLLYYLCLLIPSMFIPWLAGCATLLLLGGLYGICIPPAKSNLREIHCLRGTPKRWGLFGESDQEQNNISLGVIDLVYPSHWQPFINQDLGHKTDIDIYLDRHVVRQGRFLSLHDEVKNFPLQHWLRSLIISASALVVLVMLVVWVPLDMPIKLTISWLKGAQSIEATTLSQLESANLRVGDTVQLSGSGMCSISATDNWSAQHNTPFRPFDCSQIFWNNATPLPAPESDIVTKASALVQTVNRQLHPQDGDDTKVNPQLASAIQKSGMVLVDDFADIVQKTQALCTSNDDCIRLKNALVNLGNTKDWETLVKRADSGKLDGINVLLRPVSAESLSNLVATSTAPFFMRETSRAAMSLNSPSPGGFLIISDEGAELVDQPYPPVSLYDYPPQEQWAVFRHLAETLTHTPFHAEGIITGLSTDANGTVHIMLHSVPDSASLWRYIFTSLLLAAMVLSTLYNGSMAAIRYYRHRRRLAQIQAWYENCLNPKLIPGPGVPHLF
ncbi:Intracellular growth attenuator protein igaA [Mangrovibacter phragmitis]|uniref:Intracellular growth attenuator protein igaA n=1 Tax=Mangrovibacter phragmitis TaxID=1691903 RepID=A0A1B7L4D4_9ENTR|nr:IgaA/UmoB family intracellular growth attenuator [Mangrovibacter phragmitis]OAT77232.1 Intracellular growth attenuator protein igaA [Mangrovibacter phragmitis]